MNFLDDSSQMGPKVSLQYLRTAKKARMGGYQNRLRSAAARAKCRLHSRHKKDFVVYKEDAVIHICLWIGPSIGR